MKRFAAGAAALVIVSAGGVSAGVVAASASPASHHLAQTFQTDHQLCYVAAAAGPGITLPPPGSITLENQFGRFKPTLG